MNSDDGGAEWALDLQDGWPVLAHLVVATEQDGEVRVTACGQRRTRFTHPRGWWRTPAGEVPLSGPGDIHCGRPEHPGPGPGHDAGG